MERKLHDITKLSQYAGAELTIYFPRTQIVHIPLKVVLFAFVTDTLGLDVKDGRIACFTDEKLKEVFLAIEDEDD